MRKCCASAGPMRPHLRRDWVSTMPTGIAGGAGLDPRVQSGPAARLDIDRRVSDASTVKTTHPSRNPPQERMPIESVRSEHTDSIGIRSCGVATLPETGDNFHGETGGNCCTVKVGRGRGPFVSRHDFDRTQYRVALTGRSGGPER